MAARPGRHPWRQPITYDRFMNYARDERVALCALLADLGPDKPTLCEGWQTADLAAHLVLRERRPDAGIGIVGGPLARYTRKVQAHLAADTPYPRLINLIRTGPPRMSLMGIPGADERVNAVEFFVHHEDVRRAQPDWQPRDLDPGFSELLWRRLGMARLLLRKAPVGVELVRADAPAGSGRVRITAKAKAPVVTVTGTPAELTLWAMGRTSAAHVRLDGGDADIAALKTASWRI
jgi:uncharacterized protein (TIGR03085 family)